VKFAFIQAEKASFPIAGLCRLLGVLTAGLLRVRYPTAECADDLRPGARYAGAAAL